MCASEKCIFSTSWVQGSAYINNIKVVSCSVQISYVFINVFVYLIYHLLKESFEKSPALMGKLLLFIIMLVLFDVNWIYIIRCIWVYNFYIFLVGCTLALFGSALYP